jgi:hypothetical protein
MLRHISTGVAALLVALANITPARTQTASANSELAGINAGIESISHALAGRTCLTILELHTLQDDIQQYEEQLDSLSQRPTIGIVQPELRPISYSRYTLSQLSARISHFPRCTDENQPPLSFYAGPIFIKFNGKLRSIEESAATGQTTNSFQDSKDPFGGGLIVGAKFTPFGNNVVVSPFAEFDFFNASVNHTFANGSFLGTTENFAGTFGVKVGPQLDMGVWLYGIAGVGVMNGTLRVNFLPVASSQSATVPGGTVGLGAAWQLPGVSFPISLFTEYQHSWWGDAKFNQPPASPFFNYTFRREDDLVKVGFTIPIGPQPMPAPPALSAGAPKYPVKAK